MAHRQQPHTSFEVLDWLPNGRRRAPARARRPAGSTGSVTGRYGRGQTDVPVRQPLVLYAHRPDGYARPGSCNRRER